MSRPEQFLVLLSHSNRPVDFDQCSLDALTARYADPDRLANLPAFDTLAPIDRFRHAPAGLTLLRLTLDAGAPRLATLSTFDPPDEKVQHASLVGNRLVICLEDALLVFDAFVADALPAALDPAAARRIDDPWFSGLHTVFSSDSGRCVVSASAPDAILEVDIDAGRVVDRIRLTENRYGHNYALTATSDLRRHYVANDLQLSHLNCAAPDGEGGLLISTLIQGDIGYLDPAGGYRVLSSGHVGCHGARQTADGSHLSFADSCRGELVLLDPAGGERRRYSTGSRWLHDVQHVAGDLFACCIADDNALRLVDIATGETLLSRRFDDRGAAVQFINIHPFADSRR